MITKRVEEIKYGDILEQNIFRHDSLLALPKGTRLREREREYLKDLQVQFVYTSEYNSKREYNNEETLEILKDTIYSCTLWDEKIGSRIYDALRSKLKRKKKILDVFTMLRKIDHYSFVSSLNIALVVGKVMIVNNKVDNSLVDLIYFSLIHDIGKIKVSKITTKEGELTETEFQSVRRHPIISYRILEGFGFSKGDVLFALQTHERFDGTGYPSRLRGEEIEPLAQVIAIAEMYNALSSFRPHRPAFHPIEVRNKIEEEEDRAFSREFVQLFLDKYTPYRLDVPIELNNGMEGKIIRVNERAPMFPTVMLFNPDTGERLSEVNLYRNKDLRIARVLI